MNHDSPPSALSSSGQGGRSGTLLSIVRQLASSTHDLSHAGSLLYAIWQRLAGLPGGKWLFAQFLGLINPYTGSIHPDILELRPGFARVALHERRAVRNHVSSVHAIALMNLAELSSGLALMAGLPSETRGIPIRLSIDYLKKARGRLVAECRCTPPATNAAQEITLGCHISNAQGEPVAQAQALWRVGPKKV